MVEIEKPRIECIEKPGDNSYGKCIVEPLERPKTYFSNFFTCCIDF